MHSALCLPVFNVATLWAWKHFIIVLTGSVSYNSKIPRRPVFSAVHGDGWCFNSAGGGRGPGRSPFHCHIGKRALGM